MHKLREQISAFARQGARQSAALFRPTFDDDERKLFQKHAPTFTAAITADLGDGNPWSAIQAAANIDAERLLAVELDGKRELSGEGRQVLDALREMRHLFAANAATQDDLDREAREITAQRSGGSIVKQAARGVDEGWRDGAGNVVRVYRPQDSMAAGSRYDGPGLGEIVRAMVTGANRSEIQNALGTGSIGSGGALIPTELAPGIIDRLRARSTVIRAGARTIDLPTKVLQLAKITADPALSWAAEAAVISDVGPTFAQVTMTAKTLRAWVRLSREVAEDATNLDEVLRRVFASAMAVELDRAALVGSGTGAEPLGIGAASGAAPIVSMGANGTQLANWDKVIDVLQVLQDANAADPTAAIMAPRTAATIAKLKDSTNQPLQVPPALSQIPRYATTSIPVNQSQGTANNASSIIMGDFADLMIGIRSQLQVIRSDGRFLDSNEIGLLFVMRADVAWARAESFAQLRGIIP